MVPTNSDSTARPQIAGRQSTRYRSNAPSSTRSIAPNAAAFVAPAMNAVTGVGAPWYTSGVHMWNGAAATLNAEADEHAARCPSNSTPSSSSVVVARKSAILVRFVVPVAP